MKSFVSFYNGTKIIDLIFNYFLARSLERPRYFISSERCIILRNIVLGVQQIISKGCVKIKELFSDLFKLRNAVSLKKNPLQKNLEIPGGWGVHKWPSGREIPRGWGVKTKEPSVGGYGYFLEPHNGNRTEWSPIQSVIIRVITKLDDHAAGVRFVYHEYDYRLNWTTRSPIIN